MRRSNTSSHRTLRGMVVAIAVAGSLVLAGCSSATSTGSAEPAPEPSATATVSREAGWFQNRIRACVQNKTTRNVDYVFGEDTVDDQVKNLSQARGTMGPNAFVCGGSNNGGIDADVVTFSFTNSAGKFVDLEFGNEPSTPWFRIIYNRSKGDDDLYVLTQGKTFTKVLSDHVFEVTVGSTLRNFDKLKAYPYDVKIYDAP